MKVIEQKIRSLYHSTVFLWLVTAFFHIFSFFWICLCRHFVCFSPVTRPRTQILSLFILAAILNKFPPSVDKSVTWFLLCARVFSPAAAILESEKTLGTRLGVLNANLFNFTFLLVDFGKVLCSSANELRQNSNASCREDYIPHILTVLLDSSRLQLTFAAFCLLSVIRKQ